MRLRNLEKALTKSTHHMQVVFAVDGAVERSIVQQILGKNSNVQCRERSSVPEHETHVFTVESLHIQ